jgi:hypothetical protein
VRAICGQPGLPVARKGGKEFTGQDSCHGRLVEALYFFVKKIEEPGPPLFGVAESKHNQQQSTTINNNQQQSNKQSTNGTV